MNLPDWPRLLFYLQHQLLQRPEAEFSPLSRFLRQRQEERDRKITVIVRIIIVIYLGFLNVS